MTAARGWVAIVNPRAGGGLSPTTLTQLTTRLRTVVDTVLISEGAGHVETLVRQAHAAEGILVAGGDGTVFEVLQVLDRPHQRLGILPFGRGNSLAKDLNLPMAARAIDSVAHGVDRTIDLLAVTARLEGGAEWRGISASNLAIGYPAEVALGATRWKRLRGYSYAVAAALARPGWIDLRMALDTAAERSLTLTGVIVSNSKYVGPFLAFPSADLADGLCHVMEIRAGRLRQAVHNLSALSGLGFYEPAVVHDVRDIRIATGRGALLKVDGELRNGIRELQVRVLPNAVTVRVPAGRGDRLN